MDELKAKIVEFLTHRASRPAKVNDLLKHMDLPPSDKGALRRVLREMASEGTIARLRGQQFVLPRAVETIAGKLRVSAKGFGFVVPEEEYIGGRDEGDIFIPRKRMSDALDGDLVLVQIVSAATGTKLSEGEVIEVLERNTEELVGTFYFTKSGGHVIPRDERFNRSIITPKPNPALNVENGSYVIAEVTTWTPPTQPLLGRVREVLGDPETPGIDITMVVRDAGVEPEFSDAVMAESEAISGELPEKEIGGRTDFRDITTFTMDGITAKDFDDALSIESLDDGGWRLGVHIADVAHYVKEGTPIDQEAYDRATSIYPIDRVVPMLPEKLSNDLCSLRPRLDRLTMSCIMDIDEHGRVHEYSVHNSIIRSRHRLTYEDVQAFMDGTANEQVTRELGGIRTQLEELYNLRRVMTRMRLCRGALNLDIPETEVQFDDDGTVSGLVRRERFESHRVVEECMLIANEVVASHLFNLHVPCIYRVHEDPDTNKLRQLQPVLAHLGYRFPARHDISTDAIQSVLDKAAESETGFIIRRLILRAMMRAHYHDENLGHYGLASECYTHFTSPIRRYPDLLVHRILKDTLAAGAPSKAIYNPPGEVPPDHGIAHRRGISLLAGPPLSAKRIEYLNNNLGQWSKHCSERERRADEIEYEAAGIKALEYMQRFQGEEFEGYVTSVLEWGFFVELIDMPIEGLVHVRNLKDDFYEYDSDRMTLVGRDFGRVIKLADKVRVVVQSVNIPSQEMDFVLAEKFLAGGGKEKPVRAGKDRRGHPRHGGPQQRVKPPRAAGFRSRERRRGKN